MFIGKDKVNPWLMGLFWLSTLIIVFTNLIWVNTTEFFAYGSELGNILNNFAIGFVAAFIFYLIDIWWPAIEKRRKYYRLIRGSLNEIEKALVQPLIYIVEKYKGEVDYDIENMDDELLAKAFGSVDIFKDMTDVSKGVFGPYMNYLDFFYSRILTIEEEIKLINELNYFDEDLYEILNKIRHSFYSYKIKMYVDFQNRGETIELDKRSHYISSNRDNLALLKAFRETNGY